jgi:transcriptional regulator with XRE-family HTH domain
MKPPKPKAPATNPTDRRPNPIDLHVGSRVRMRRKILRVSQEKLAEGLDLTFQQVQKYERGANRISASKLFEIAKALNTPVSYFFDGLHETTNPALLGFAEAGNDQFVHDFLMTSEGMELAMLFPKIPKGRVRRRLLDLVRAMGEPNLTLVKSDHGPEAS